MRATRRALTILALLMTWQDLAKAENTNPECKNLASFQSRKNRDQTALTSRDLIEIRNIGGQALSGPAPIFSIAPDGQRIAFHLYRADPAQNRYCSGIYIADIDRPDLIREIDTAAEVVFDEKSHLGVTDYRVGSIKVITPQWSPNGDFIYYLKSTNGRAQIWRSPNLGHDPEQLTSSTSGILTFLLSDSGTTLFYRTAPDLRAQMAGISSEKLRGYHFDERFFPSVASFPLPVSDRRPEDWALDLSSAVVRPATVEETKTLDGASTWQFPQNSNGYAAPILRTTGTRLPTETQVLARLPNGHDLPCTAEQCTGEISEAWPAPTTGHIFFIRREGWANGDTAVYEWNVTNGNVLRRHISHDYLFDCAPVNADFICGLEGATTPRRIVRYSNDFSVSRLLIDPNPEFRRFRLGRVERVNIRNSFGAEAYSDIVYPPGFQRDKGYPALVVQYNSRGFLRGGTGDEMPIHVLADLGYVVISTQRPSAYDVIRPTSSLNDAQRQATENFRDRRSALSSIELGRRLISAQPQPH